jgi:hypothetical protein
VGVGVGLRVRAETSEVGVGIGVGIRSGADDSGVWVGEGDGKTGLSVAVDFVITGTVGVSDIDFTIGTSVSTSLF